MTCCICIDDDVPTLPNPCTRCKGTAGSVVYCATCLPNLDENACPFCRNRSNCYRCPGCKLFRIREGIFCEGCNGYLCLNCSLDTFGHDHPIPCTSVWNVCFRRKGFLWKFAFIGMALFLHWYSPNLVPTFYTLAFINEWPSNDMIHALYYWFMMTIMFFSMVVPFFPDMIMSDDFDAFRMLFGMIGAVFADCILFATPK